jgi:hypothetical protein
MNKESGYQEDKLGGGGQESARGEAFWAGGYGKIDTRTKSILHLNPKYSIIKLS